MPRRPEGKSSECSKHTPWKLELITFDQANASSLSKDPSDATWQFSVGAIFWRCQHFSSLSCPSPGEVFRWRDEGPVGRNMAGYADLTTVTQRKMELIVDLEKPIGPESPLFAVLLKPRPEPLKPEASKPVPFKQPAKLSPKEQEELREAYWRHVASPVQKFGGDGRHELPEGITSIIPGRAWVVSHLLSEEECANVIKAGEIFGLLPAAREAGTQGLRTNKRTGNYCSVDLSTLVGPRLPPALLDFIEESKPHTAVRGIHPNWRIARYDNEEFFAAHYDQADSLTLRTEDGSKERYDSSHTLLISLSDRSAFQGGATRFWPTATYDDTAIDVELPCGWAVIFEQKLLHAGLPVQGVKHIAQAGILRGMPSGVGHRPSTFRLGPGLTFTWCVSSGGSAVRLTRLQVLDTAGSKPPSWNSQKKFLQGKDSWSKFAATLMTDKFKDVCACDSRLCLTRICKNMQSTNMNDTVCSVHWTYPLKSNPCFGFRNC